ncbi:MAG: hypothetical protein M1482_02230 [Chloroflexi bacterium]|nr:hypothetical protein [Chloroflexota bacterium]
MLDPSNGDQVWWVVFFALVLALAVVLIGIAALIPGSPLIALVSGLFNWLFGLNSVQAMWYVTRAAGLTAYLLLWLSTVWGLAVSSKIFDPVLHRYFTYDMHQFISLLAIGFVALHVAVLLADAYLPFSIAQIVLPFGAPYRPVWVGVGVIALYLTLLVSVTFYVRRWIGQKAFRVIHYLSFLAFAGAAAHGLMAGTDSPLWATQLMYAGTTLAVVFLLVYRVAISVLTPRAARMA